MKPADVWAQVRHRCFLRQEMASSAAPAARCTVISAYTDHFPLVHPYEAQVYIRHTFLRIKY